MAAQTHIFKKASEFVQEFKNVILYESYYFFISQQGS